MERWLRRHWFVAAGFWAIPSSIVADVPGIAFAGILAAWGVLDWVLRQCETHRLAGVKQNHVYILERQGINPSRDLGG